MSKPTAKDKPVVRQPFYKSKAFWATAAAVGVAVAEQAVHVLPGPWSMLLSAALAATPVAYVRHRRRLPK